MNDNSKYIAINQRKSFISLLLLYIFFFFHCFHVLLSLCNLSCTQKHHLYNLYCILHTFSFYYVTYYIVFEIYIGCFLEDCFYCYSKEIKSAAAKESLIPYNLTQRVLEKQNLYYCNLNGNPNQIEVKLPPTYIVFGYRTAID